MTFPPIFIPAASGIASGIQSNVLDNIGTGATAAYSAVRRLRAAYSGSLIRVRRSSDNTEQDIGVSGGLLDTASLLSFCGANNGFIVTLYDQSGNGYDMTQATTSLQPQIVSSGSLITTINGQPSMLFATDRLATTATVANLLSASAYTIICAQRTATSDVNGFYNGGNTWADDGGYLWCDWGAGVNEFVTPGHWDGAIKQAQVTLPGAFPNTGVVHTRFGSGTIYAGFNGGTEASQAAGNISTTTGAVRLGQNYTAGASWDGHLSEIVFYNAYLSTADLNTIGAALADVTGTTWTTVT